MCSLEAESSFTIPSWDLRAQHWKLFIGPCTSSLYLGSVMLAYKLGSCLTRMGFSSLLQEKICYLSLAIIIIHCGAYAA